MNNLNLVFLSQVFAECVQMTSSLTIWKADINTGIYMVWGVSRVLIQIINTKLLLAGISPVNNGDYGSSSET